jgi:BolA family transcriptional regulator, general stress-responsive regulator
MKIETSLREKLTAGLTPEHLELTNESPMHGLPLNAEKHFRVVAVSPAFAELSRIDRHRKVHALVAEELRDHVHALSVQAYTPEEWSARSGQGHVSPECLGGSKHDKKFKL